MVDRGCRVVGGLSCLFALLVIVFLVLGWGLGVYSGQGYRVEVRKGGVQGFWTVDLGWIGSLVSG